MAENDKAVQDHAEIVSKKKIFEDQIFALEKALNGLKYAIISTDDGFPVATTKMDVKEATRKAAMTASLDGLSKTVAMESGYPSAISTQVECDDGFIISRIIYLKEDKSMHVVILVATDSSETIATVTWNLKKAIQTIIEKFNA